jgi:hypothetical protein
MYELVRIAELYVLSPREQEAYTAADLSMQSNPRIDAMTRQRLLRHMHHVYAARALRIACNFASLDDAFLGRRPGLCIKMMIKTTMPALEHLLDA